MLHGYIVDLDTGKNVAVIRHGEVFRDDQEGARIATVVNGNLYDLSGNFVGRLDGPHAIDVRTWSMPIAMRNFLKMTPRDTPFPLSNKEGGPKAALSSSYTCTSQPQSLEQPEQRSRDPDPNDQPEPRNPGPHADQPEPRHQAGP
jgi:hypothetical protein